MPPAYWIPLLALGLGLFVVWLVIVKDDDNGTTV